MDRSLKEYDMESMKKVMLKHEETFKEQVYELHRLYRIQTRLMNDLKTSGVERQPKTVHPNECNIERWNVESKTGLHQFNYRNQKRPLMVLDLERPAEEYITDDGGDVMLKIEQESDIKLTLGTGFSQRKKDEISLASDSGASFSSSSTESSTMKKTTRTNTREKIIDHDWGLFLLPDMNTDFQNERKNSFDVEEQLRQERLKQPPWLFHVLSLNMT